MASKSNQDDFLSFVKGIAKNNPEKVEKIVAEYSRQHRGRNHDWELLGKIAKENGLVEFIPSYMPPESETRRRLNDWIPFALLLICVALLIIIF
ncbi:MAG: hypothetical protein AAFX95_28145 [Cyanobacteria bacterium J06639_16]